MRRVDYATGMPREPRTVRRERPARDVDPQRAAEYQDILAQLRLTYAQRLAHFTASMRSLEWLRGATIRPQTPAERQQVLAARRPRRSPLP